MKKESKKERDNTVNKKSKVDKREVRNLILHNNYSVVIRAILIQFHVICYKLLFILSRLKKGSEIPCILLIYMINKMLSGEFYIFIYFLSKKM